MPGIYHMTGVNGPRIGAEYTRSFTYKDNDGVVIPLTSYTAALKIRAGVRYNAQTASGWSLGAVLLDCAPYLAIDAPNGKVTLTIPANITAALTQTLQAWYDLELIPPGGGNDQFKLLEGDVEIYPEASA